MVEKRKLTGIFDAIGWGFSFLFAEKRWWWVLKASAIYYAAAVVVALPAIVTVGAIVWLSSREGNPVVIALLVAVAVLSIVVWGGFSVAYYTGMFIEIYNDRRTAPFELVKKSWQKLFGFFGLSMTVGLLTMLGYILLVVPGIIWSITYGFALNVMYENGGKVGEAMASSKQMTDGYKWELFKKLLVAFVLSAVVSGLFSGLTQNNHSVLLWGVSLTGSMLVNAVVALVYLKYYYELKR